MAQNRFKNIKISGVSVVIPNSAKASTVEGCKKYYISPLGVTNVDMCEVAAKNIIENMNISVNSIDAVVFVHQYPDHLSPSSSHIVHKRLALPVDCSVFDIYHGGAGYVYGLWVVSSMITTGFYKKVLLLAGEHINEINTNFDAGYCLSSAGSATLLEYDISMNESFFNITTDSIKYEDIIIPAGAYRLPVTHEILDTKIKDKNDVEWSMLQKLYNMPSFKQFIYDNVPSCVSSILSYSNSCVDNIDFFAFNQVSATVVNDLASMIGISENTYSTNTFLNYGNQTVVSSLFNLVDCMKNNLINQDNKVCFISYGEGLSCATAILNINKIYCSDIIIIDAEGCVMPDKYTLYWVNRMKQNS